MNNNIEKQNANEELKETKTDDNKIDKAQNTEQIEKANIKEADIEETKVKETNIKETNIKETDIEEANAKEVNIKENNKKGKKIRRWIVAIFIIVAMLAGYVAYRGEYLETLELGEQYLSVFYQNVTYRLATFGACFVIFYLLIYFTNRRIKKGLTPFFEEDKKQIPKIPNKSIAFIGAVIISFIVSNNIMEKLMLFINSTAFEMTDPVLGYDIGFFIFQQPFIKTIIQWAIDIMTGLTAYMGVYYIVVFNKYLNGINRETLKKSKLVKQICNNIVLIAFLTAVQIFVETNNVGLQKFINLSDGYGIFGAGISEVTIKLWGYRILSILMLICVFIAQKAFKKGNTKKVLISLATVPIYLFAMLIVLFGFQMIFVNQNELDKQQTYIKANIESTKNAYNINIEEVNLGENETITTKTLSENSDVINNIVMISKDTVLKNLNTLQTNKGYYTYPTTQIVNYNIDGKSHLTYVSAREISNTSRTYDKKTYEYTHGYGIIITSASKVDEKGNLLYLQRNFTNNNIVNISEPRIYFGLETNDIIVTNNNGRKEFDYPIAESTKAENAENSYEGQAGLNLNFLDRMILGFKKGDLVLAFSGNVDENSKILINRNIVERAKTLLPYIIYDEEPYLVTTDEGKLIWVLDGYTISNEYPYSQRTTIEGTNILETTELNYIRNSVKVLVDAYDGTIKFYITDRTDPIIMAYQKMYKDLFVDKDEQIPEDISSKFVYSKFLYNIQAEVIKRYHNVQTDVLYREDDVWQTATQNTSKTLTKTGTEIEPYYTMVKTIDSSEECLALVLPYTPYQKQNMNAYLIGKYENSQPKLTLYKYPLDTNVLGPIQIDTQLEQDEGISKEIANLNVTGTKITKNMIVVPINNSLLYVEPIYQQDTNEENSTPILKKIVVASGNKVAIGNTLEEALSNLLSQYAVDIEIENTDTINDLIDAIIKANENLEQSNKSNNWEMIGKDMNKLQELINKLQKLVEAENKKETTNVKEKSETLNNEVN